MCLGTELFIAVDLLGLFLFTDEQHIRQNVDTLLYTNFYSITVITVITVLQCIYYIPYTVDMLWNSVYYKY